MANAHKKRGRGETRSSEFEEEVIQIDRVTRVVKGGRRLRFRATVVIGNKKGKVGVGIGKSLEVQGAIKKAIAHAKKSLIEVPIISETIPHEVKMKFKSAKLMIMPACPGTGIIAGGPLRKILELAGVKNVMSKVLGCKNRLSNSQAAILALSQLRMFPWYKKVIPVAKSAVAVNNFAKEIKENEEKITNDQAPNLVITNDQAPNLVITNDQAPNSKQTQNSK